MLRGIGETCVESLYSQSDLPTDRPYGSNLGHKIAGFVFLTYYPTALKGIVLTHGVPMCGQAAGKSLSSLYLRNLRCRKLILDRDIG